MRGRRPQFSCHRPSIVIEKRRRTPPSNTRVQRRRSLQRSSVASNLQHDAGSSLQDAFEELESLSQFAFSPTILDSTDLDITSPGRNSVLRTCPDDSADEGYHWQEFDLGPPPMSECETTSASGDKPPLQILLTCPVCMADWESGTRWAHPDTCPTHLLCVTCLTTWSEKTNLCPICRAEFSSITVFDPSDNNATVESLPVEHRKLRVEDMAISSSDSDSDSEDTSSDEEQQEVDNESNNESDDDSNSSGSENGNNSDDEQLRHVVLVRYAAAVQRTDRQRHVRDYCRVCSYQAARTAPLFICNTCGFKAHEVCHDWIIGSANEALDTVYCTICAEQTEQGERPSTRTRAATGNNTTRRGRRPSRSRTVRPLMSRTRRVSRWRR